MKPTRLGLQGLILFLAGSGSLYVAIKTGNTPSIVLSAFLIILGAGMAGWRK